MKVLWLICSFLWSYVLVVVVVVVNIVVDVVVVVVVQYPLLMSNLQCIMRLVSVANNLQQLIAYCCFVA